MPNMKLSELGLDKENVQEGDKLEFTVKSVDGDDVELDYSPDLETPDENPKTMPLDKLRGKMVEQHGQSDEQGY